MSEPDNATEPPSEPLEALGRSYQSVLAKQAGITEGPETTPEAAPVEASSAPASPVRIVEALLFVGGIPLTAARAGEIVRGLTPERFSEAIAALNRDYRRQGRPYVIQAQGQGYVLTLRPRFRSVLSRLYGTVREARLSPAAIDVLALIAYRQPATKQEVDGLRGAESGNLLRQLVRRGLISVVQRGDADQHEVAYGTTARFLKLFALTSLDDLPRTQDLQQM
jgi:segregation and condensation protein B